MKKYHIIYADPPWSYRDKKRDGRTKCGAANHYKCMDLEALEKLPVKDIAEDNAVLFLWTTFPLLLDQKDPWLSAPGRLMKAWGFEYRTVGFVWVKTNKDDTIWHGVGSYAKSNAEVCLMGVRGKVGRLMKDDKDRRIKTDPKDKLSVISNNVSSVVLSNRKRHSQKPAEVRRNIVKLFGKVSRIELFARSGVKGWDSIGLEMDGLSIEQALKK